MFVRSTLLSGIDRLSTSSVLTGRTSSLLGICGSLLLIALIFILFLDPVVEYFRGDYVQSSFKLNKREDIQMVSGCDFKLAISFYDRETNQIANHSKLLRLLDINTVFGATIFYESGINSCRQDYFEGIEGDPKLKSNQCFQIADNMLFQTIMSSEYLTVFGLVFFSHCDDPFTCTSHREFNENTTREVIQFFDDYYYTLYFTSEKINAKGERVKIVNQAYETQYNIHQDFKPRLFVAQNLQQFHLDSSIMPWRNNRVETFTAWHGQSLPSFVQEENILQESIYAVNYFNSEKEVSFRYYKKLDEAIGLLGGSIFILFLIFAAVFRCYNLNKQKIEVCESLFLKKNVPVEEITIPWYYYLISPFKCCARRVHSMIQSSERMIDIATILKKQKVAERNLTNSGKRPEFKSKSLCFEGNIILSQDKFNPKLQLCPQAIDIAKSLNQSNNPLKNGEKEEDIEKDQIENDIENYSKFKQTYLTSKTGKCKTILKKVIKFFDVFGAQPTFSTHPHNSSIFSFMVTAFIIILSILTFALTIHNMSQTKIYMDQIYLKPEDFSVDLEINENFKIALCMPEAMFENEYIIGPNRFADLKFYHAVREGDTETLTYIKPRRMKDQKRNYFMLSQSEHIDLDNCFRMPDGSNVSVSGSQVTDSQSYFGFIIEPYCQGDVQQCQSSEGDRNKDFKALMKILPLWLIFPENKFSPEVNKIVPKVVVRNINDASTSNNDQIFETAYEETIYPRTVQLLDNTDTWFLGGKPRLIDMTLTGSHEKINQVSENIESASSFYYKFKIKANGEVDRVILENMKLDYLLAIMGGCFFFFYLIFGCIGKLFNFNRVRRNLANVLYGQISNYLCLTYFFKRFGFCCTDKGEEKLSDDLDLIGIVRKTQNIFLHSAQIQEKHLECDNLKHLSMVYFKEDVDADQRIKSDEQLQKKEQLLQEVETMDFDELITANQDIKIQKHDEEPDKEYVYSPFFTHKVRKNHFKIFELLDLFTNPAQFTFEGERKIKSVCGGICCIIMVIFIIFLLQFSLSLYFSNLHTTSYEKIPNQEEASSLQLSSGMDFKFLISFFTGAHYEFHNVSEQVQNVSISLIKQTFSKAESQTQTTEEYFELQPCKKDYLDGFIGDYMDQDYYRNITLGYCLPDNIDLNISGEPSDDVRNQFMISIHQNKDVQNSKYYVERLLQNFLVRIHMSVPIKDFSDNQIKYEMKTFARYHQLSDHDAKVQNITLTKISVIYDTQISASTIDPVQTLYDYETNTYSQNAINVPENLVNTRYMNITFDTNSYHTVYTVRKIKANELLGLIGGILLLMFVGIGGCVKSFNEYRLRYLIGSKLYALKPSRKIVLYYKRQNGQLQQKPSDQELKRQRMELIRKYNNVSEIQLLWVWFLSFIGFVRGNYNFNDRLRRVSLIEERATEDLSLVNFYKNTFANERSAAYLLQEKLQLDGKLCRVYGKKPFNGNGFDVQCDEHLQKIGKKNELSDWQIKAIQQSKQELGAQAIFKQKTIQNYFKKFRKQEKEQPQLIELNEDDDYSPTIENLDRRKKKSIIEEYEMAQEQ